jgi:hypothetical protein
MARARMLKSGADAHDFTPEERAKGGRARAEKLRERREAAQAFADGELQAVLAAALHELEELFHSDDPRVKLKAAVVILDRMLSRLGQSGLGTIRRPSRWRRTCTSSRTTSRTRPFSTTSRATATEGQPAPPKSRLGLLGMTRPNRARLQEKPSARFGLSRASGVLLLRGSQVRILPGALPLSGEWPVGEPLWLPHGESGD